MIGNPLKIKAPVSQMSRGGSRAANELPEGRRMLAGAMNDVLEA